MSLPTSRGFYRAEAKYADLLKRVGLVDGMSVFEHPKIEVWRSITERENCVLDAEGTRLHIKRNKPGRAGVEAEADAIRLLMNANLPTVPLVAAGRLNDGRGFLITEDLAGYEDADIAVRAGRPFETVLNATAELAGRLHAGGLHHRDMYLCHFYVATLHEDQAASDPLSRYSGRGLGRGSANGGLPYAPQTPSLALPRAYTGEGTSVPAARLMDAGRVKPLPNWFRRRWIVKDVAQMVYSLKQLGIESALIDQWLAAYTTAGGAAVDAGFRKSVDRKVAAIARHDRALRRRDPNRNVSIDR